jgi:hypothetical protein
MCSINKHTVDNVTDADGEVRRTTIRQMRIGGLKPATTYELQVKTVVGGNRHTSGWSIITLATTKDARKFSTCIGNAKCVCSTGRRTHNYWRRSGGKWRPAHLLGAAAHAQRQIDRWVTKANKSVLH